MNRYIAAMVIATHVFGLGAAHADPATRVAALLRHLAPPSAHIEQRDPPVTVETLPLRDTGDGAESLFCLTFDRRDTIRMLRVRKAHAYVCFNFLRNPSEAVGNILDKRGRQRCLITGFFGEGLTLDDDCLVLAFCGKVLVAGSCS